METLKRGTKVLCNGYEGVIVSHYADKSYEIRLPGGICCTADFVVTEQRPTEQERRG